MSPIPVAGASSSTVPWTLGRRQVVAKIGSRDCHYPRPRGVLIPRELIEICRGVGPLAGVEPRLVGTESFESRRRLGRLVRATVHRSLQHVSADLLEVRLPNPRMAAATLRLSDRTRNVIGRVPPLVAPEREWTVRQYLEIGQFGAYCLLDMLAAREESARAFERDGAHVEAPAANVTADDLRLPLDEISDLISARALLPSADLGALIVGAGLATRPLTVGELLSSYRAAGRRPTFRVVKLHGVDFAVIPGGAAIVRALVATATRFVASWGLTTVDTVASRIRAQTAFPLDAVTVGQLLQALPRFRWLDERAGWFSFEGEKSHLGLAIRKIFAVADRVPLDDLRVALSKSASGFRHVPPAAVEQYLSEVAGCQIREGWVSRRDPRPAPIFTATEQMLVRLFERVGREIEWETLKRLMATASMTVSAMCRLIARSPLVLRTGATHIRLIGLSHASALG